MCVSVCVLLSACLSMLLYVYIFLVRQVKAGPVMEDKLVKAGPMM